MPTPAGVSSDSVIFHLESILEFPSVGNGLLDIGQCCGIECAEVFKLAKYPIHWLVVGAEFDGDGQRSSVGLHSEVERRLVVDLVFSRKPNCGTLEREPGQDSSVGEVVVPLDDDGAYLFDGGLVCELSLHEVCGTILAQLVVPSYAPFVLNRIDALDARCVLISLYSVHDEFF